MAASALLPSGACALTRPTMAPGLEQTVANQAVQRHASTEACALRPPDKVKVRAQLCVRIVALGRRMVDSASPRLLGQLRTALFDGSVRRLRVFCVRCRWPAPVRAVTSSTLPHAVLRPAPPPSLASLPRLSPSPLSLPPLLGRWLETRADSFFGYVSWGIYLDRSIDG